MGVCRGSASLLLCCCCFLALTAIAPRCSATGDHPKIITEDGNLFIQSALDRNITFKLKGKSRLLINDRWDVLAVLRQPAALPIASDDAVAPTTPTLDELKDQVKVLQMGVFHQQMQYQFLMDDLNMHHRLSYVRGMDSLEARIQAVDDRLNADNCKSAPCENGGTCSNGFGDFTCKCTQYFEGAKCESDVDECVLYAGTDLGCQNGAQCVNQLNGYACLCSSGWYGVHCTQRNNCTRSSATEMCGHGTCVADNGNGTYGYQCICDQGWKTNGLTPGCTVDVDECAEMAQPPCATRCINLPGSFTCGPCVAGLTGNGLVCRDIDECALQNGGCSQQPFVVCINTYGSSHCGQCPLGWMGDGRTCVRSDSDGDNGVGDTPHGGSIQYNCGDANICHPLAKCALISDAVICTCPDGMEGSGVGLSGCAPRSKLNCNALPCQNAGTCFDTENDDGYLCLCPAGFEGPHCATAVNSCADRPCANDGVCQVTNASSFECHCMPGYMDRLCRTTTLSGCGGALDALTGRLQYHVVEPSSSDLNTECIWMVQTMAELVLNVTFAAFELEDNSECRSNSLQIYDGNSGAARLIDTFCGAHKPLGQKIVSNSNGLYLSFRYRNATAKTGFTLLWNSTQPSCGDTREFEISGRLESPDLSGQYQKSLDCRWHLRAPNNKRIRLVFFHLQLEFHDSCNYDYLAIQDALSGNELAKYCTTRYPRRLLLATNEIFVHFHTDREGSDKGFLLYYIAADPLPGCGGTYTAREGAIKSPTRSSAYESIACEYDVRLTANESIVIEFVSVALGPDDCLEFYDIDVTRNFTMLQDKYCGNYDYQPTTLRSLYNAVRIKYYAKGLAPFELRYRADCSYVYTGESGVIVSPDYPQLLPSAARTCTYTIRSRPGTMLFLHAVDFNMRTRPVAGEEDESCLDTSLTIRRDGLELGGPYCDSMPPDAEMIVDWNALRLVYETGGNSIGRGFKYEYKVIPIGEKECGGLYTEPGHTIRSPTARDGKYKDELECYWLIQAPAHKGIALTWHSFSVEVSTECTVDYVEVYDVVFINDGEQPLAKYCGYTVPPMLVTTSTQLVLKFVSDESEGFAGFEATYEFIDTSKQCGGDIHATSGMLKSPAYPANYTNDVDCTWTITAPPGTQIELLIDMFELEATPHCTSDWLEVRNGAHAQSTLVGSFCGTAIPRRIPSFTNHLRLHFHSNSFLNARGFKIQWIVFSNSCGGNLLGDLGTITSPNYPNAYPHNAECEWLVQVTRGSAIVITIVDIRIEHNDGCRDDQLKIFDDRESNVPVAMFCGLPNAKPREIQLDSSEALVRFVSDLAVANGGFMLSFRAQCNRTIHELVGAIDSPNKDDSYYYQKPISCAWKIIAPKGNRIALEFNYLDGEGDSGAIYLIEPAPGDSAGAAKEHTRVIRERGAYNSSGDTLTVMQNSTHVNFRLEYAVVGCVERFYGDEGGFVSPNYPLYYPNNVECLWEIFTKVGNRITLRISNIDIEETPNCTKDALIISKHPTNHDVTERHCGKYRVDLLITSNSHRLYVRFVSDGRQNARGFNASYTISKSTCGGEMQSRYGIITSQNYPHSYPLNADCEWSITVSPHHTITLTLDDLDLGGSRDCDWGSLVVYEPSNSSRGNEKLILRKCSELGENESNKWSTKTNKAIVRFYSYKEVQAYGFKLSYQESCGQRIVISELANIEMERSGINDNSTCVWSLETADRSEHVRLIVTHVKMNPQISEEYLRDGDCIEHGVKIYDGDDVTAPVSHKFCKIHPPEIESTGHALTIAVPFGVISEFSAAYAVKVHRCGWEFDTIQGEFSSPSFPVPYDRSYYCEWTLKASSGNAITLTIESLSMEESDHCSKDYLEVRERDSSGPLRGLFCGGPENMPGPIVGVSGLWVLFRTDKDIGGQGFMASYNYAMHNELNGTGGIIQSPRYPAEFHAVDTYSWRINVEQNQVVQLTVKFIVDSAMPYIKFYDGYMDIGAPIEYANKPFVRTESNILYFTATQGPFEIQWEAMPKEDVVATNKTAARYAEKCGTVTTLTVNAEINLLSPGYMHGNYDYDLNCSWTFMPATRGRHVVLNFEHIDLEEFENCAADYVRVSTSNNMQHWHQLAHLCGEDPEYHTYHGIPYLKLDFVTDSEINRRGFDAIVQTHCGSELLDRAGLVNITQWREDHELRGPCNWTIHVRPGRRIRITFLESYLRREDHSECRTHFIVRNGIDNDSPFLGSGKFCDNNITEVLETSSNRAFIHLSIVDGYLLRAAFHYEEIAHQCSDEIALNADTKLDSMKTINSPQYPNRTKPHTECVWLVTAPRHHVITIDFAGRFEMADAADCKEEYVELNDGASALMPSMGRFCGKRKPGRLVSNNNVLRVHYFNDLSEPHTGFSANVSIARCGGFYVEDEGVIETPTQLRLHNDEMANFECVYTIDLEPGRIINLTIVHIDFHDNTNCSFSHLVLEEFTQNGTDEFISKTHRLCGRYKGRHLIVETNKLVVRHKIIEELVLTNRFRLQYSSRGMRCGETVVASRGILQTPNYPNGVQKRTICSWFLTVPKGRRVKLEILDWGVASSNGSRLVDGQLILANDISLDSLIKIVNQQTALSAVFYSTDNTMGIRAYLQQSSTHRGFKLRFSSDEPSTQCLEIFTRNAMHYVGDNNTRVYCRHYVDVKATQTLAVHVTEIEHTYSNEEMRNVCYYDARLKQSIPIDIHLPIALCQNAKFQPQTFRFGFPVTLVLYAYKEVTALNLNYKLHECGGLRLIGSSNAGITEPQMNPAWYNGRRLDCAWLMAYSPEIDRDYNLSYDRFTGKNAHLTISVITNIKGNCNENYIQLYNGLNQNAPTLGRYCGASRASNLIAENGLFVEYVTANYDPTSRFFVDVDQNSGCGGILRYPFREIIFHKQYEPNVECIWDVISEPGYQVGLTFHDRFYIESSPNCTKDYLLIQESVDSDDEWHDLQRICGREPPVAVNTTTTRMRIIFRSDNETEGDGFTAHFNAQCGGTFQVTGDQQWLTSPGFPNRYDNNLTCRFEFLPMSTDTGILVRFRELYLNTSECATDYINVTTWEVQNGRPMSKVFCFNSIPAEIRAKQRMTIAIQAHKLHGGLHFRFAYSVVQCGGQITNSTLIASPSEDDHEALPYNSHCLWNLTAPAGYKILVKFVQLDFGSFGDCDFEGVAVYGGNALASEARRALLCGNFTGQQLPYLTIPQNTGLVRSKFHFASHGFRALIAFRLNCDRNVFLSASNASYDFNLYANGYATNLNCEHVITTEPGRQLLLRFYKFHMEQSEECSKDYLDIYDGGGSFGDLMAKLCGHEMPQTQLMTTRHTLYMRFVSDGAKTSAGVGINIESVPTICGRHDLHVDGNETVTIRAPTDADGNYLKNLNCVWRIRSNQSIYFHFNKLDLHVPDEFARNGSCGSNYLKVYSSSHAKFIDGGYGNKTIFNGHVGLSASPRLDFTHSSIYCGNANLSNLYHFGKEVYLNLRTDAQHTAGGFSLMAAASYGCYNNFTDSSGRIVVGKTILDCDIYITALANQTLSLFYVEMEFPKQNCNLASVEVFDAHTNVSLQRLCPESVVDITLFSNTSALRLHIKMDGESEFYMVYMANTDGIGCGGSLYTNWGILSSPYFPQEWRENALCRWELRVPQNLVAVLYLHHLRLGDKSNCDSVYLQIIEYDADATSHVVRQYCGGDYPDIYISTKNHVAVYYHNTGNHEGIRWTITYTGRESGASIDSYSRFW